MTDGILHQGKDIPLYILRCHRLHNLHITLKLNNTKLKEIVPYERPTQSEIVMECRVLDLRPRGCGFEPHWHHCVVVLEQDTFILA